MKKLINKIVALMLISSAGVLLPASPRLASLSPSVAYAEEEDGAIGIIGVILVVVSLSAVGGADCDRVENADLIEQAYLGQGEKLALVARTAHLSVEETADRIVGLDKIGKLDRSHPKEMAQVIGHELNRRN